MKYLFPATPLMPEYVTHVFLACWHKKSFEMFCHHWYFDILSKKKKTLHKSSHHILIFSSHMWVGVGGWAKNVFTYFCVLNVPCKKSSPHLSQHVLKGVDGKKIRRWRWLGYCVQFTLVLVIYNAYTIKERKKILLIFARVWWCLCIQPNSMYLLDGGVWNKSTVNKVQEYAIMSLFHFCIMIFLSFQIFFLRFLLVALMKIMEHSSPYSNSL